MRIKYKSALYAACYGGSYKHVKKLLKRDNKHVPARQRAKAFKLIKTDFNAFLGVLNAR
jgi:translation elongation factor EF-4